MLFVNEWFKENVSKVKFWIKVAVLCAGIAVVWLMYLLPLIIFNLPKEVKHNMILFNVHSLLISSNIMIYTGSSRRLHVWSTCQLWQCDWGCLVIRNCSLAFFLNSQTGFCSPLCAEWEEFPHDVVVAFQAAITINSLLHFIGTVLALVLSCYNHKIMWVQAVPSCTMHCNYHACMHA